MKNKKGMVYLASLVKSMTITLHKLIGKQVEQVEECRADQEEANGEDQEGHASTWDRFYFKDHGINLSYGETVYITITYDGNNNVNSFYLNGKPLLVAPERENTDVWNKFTQRIKEVENKHIEIGRYTFEEGTFKGASGYLEGSAYCFRIYGRSLSEKEVLKNYEKSVEYHSILTK